MTTTSKGLSTCFFYEWDDYFDGLWANHSFNLVFVTVACLLISTWKGNETYKWVLRILSLHAPCKHGKNPWLLSWWWFNPCWAYHQVQHGRKADASTRVATMTCHQNWCQWSDILCWYFRKYDANCYCNNNVNKDDGNNNYDNLQPFLGKWLCSYTITYVWDSWQAVGLARVRGRRCESRMGILAIVTLLSPSCKCFRAELLGLS